MKHKKRSFVSRLVISYSLVLSLVLTALFGAAYFYIIRVSEQSAAIGQEQLLEKTATQVEYFYSEMNQIAEKVRVDSALVSVFASLRDDLDGANYFDTNIMAAIDAQSRLRTIVGPAPSIFRVILYNQHGDMISTDHELMAQSGTPLDPQTVAALIEQLRASDGKSMVMPVSNDVWTGSDSVRCLSYVTLLTNYYKTEVYGVIEVQQTVEQLESYIGPEGNSGTYTFLFDESGAQIYPASPGLSEFLPSAYAIREQEISALGLRVVLAQDKSLYTQPYRSVILYLVVATLAIMIFIFAMFYLVTNAASKPLVSLTRTVRDISLESMPTEIEPESSSEEMKNLTDAFNAMITRLNESISVEKRSYLLALQSQMNPHFLYNSLSTITSMGLECGSEEIVEFCERLSSMLRYSTAHDSRPITLADELENTNNYLGLMKLRYEDNLHYTVDVPEHLMSLPIPRLTLQPIVENCFEHGFKNVRPPWEVRISATSQGGAWQLSICDNGSGISALRMQELERRIAVYSRDISNSFGDMQIGGLGLVNTIVRLRLASGGTIRCTVEPMQPTGTQVRLEGMYGHTHIDR